jgi:hypothetical protein
VSDVEDKDYLPKILDLCNYIYSRYTYERENNAEFEEDRLNVIEENGI